jgi:hypothetical protein
LQRVNDDLVGPGVLHSGPYSYVIEVLGEIWKGALKGNALGSWLSNDKKDFRMRWTDEIYRILDREFGPNVMYTDWNKAITLSGELIKDKSASSKLTGDEKMRDVINGAWFCRLNNPPERSKDIGKISVDLSFELI